LDNASKAIKDNKFHLLKLRSLHLRMLLVWPHNRILTRIKTFQTRVTYWVARIARMPNKN
jgi:hypothetical protein